MLRLLVPLVLVLLTPFASAQEKETKQSLNQKAVDQLKAGKFDEGIALLMRIFEIPGLEKDADTAYNLACSYSLKQDVDKGFEWLEKSVDWGWGEGQGQLVGATKPSSHAEMTRTDPDLELLRKDPRFEPLMERMAKAVERRQARIKVAEAYAATAAIHIPEKIKEMAEMPILIVLHDEGSTKDAVVSSHWKEIADELGFALIAPSGKILVGDEPEKGMTWFDDFDAYKTRYSTFERPVFDAVSAFKKAHPIDKSRVVIAGEGLGAFVALNTAIGNPGMIKGAVALNHGVNPDVMAPKAPTAGKMGLRVRILVDPADLSKRMAAEGGKGEDGAKLIESWTKSLQTWGITGEVKTITADAAATKAMIVEAVGAVLARDPAAAAK